MLVIIDNYDSFTYNLVQYFLELGENVRVFKNDEVDIKEIEKNKPTSIVISPGPATPNEAGISLEVIKKFSGDIPILGVCLGHQSIGQVFGGEVINASEIMHGKTSVIHHVGKGVFRDLQNPFVATRYHSLVVNKKNIPDCFEITAWTESPDRELNEIMGLRHKKFLIEGVQFHPEAILSQHGHDLLTNFLNYTS